MHSHSSLRLSFGARPHRLTARLRSRFGQSTQLVALAAVGFLATGCATHYKFGVEAIKQSDALVPHQSFRLVDARPDSRPGDPRFDHVARDVQTALSGKGLYPAPEGTTPQLIIEVDFGVSAPVVTEHIRREPVYLVMNSSSLGGQRPGSGHMETGTQPRYVGDREVPYLTTTCHKYLRITAREPLSSATNATPRQAWSVMVTNDDPSDNLAEYARLMVAAALDSIGSDTERVRQVVLTKRDDRVTFVEKGLGSS
jgi:hypothetical protein